MQAKAVPSAPSSPLWVPASGHDGTGGYLVRIVILVALCAPLGTRLRGHDGVGGNDGWGDISPATCSYPEGIKAP